MRTSRRVTGSGPNSPSSAATCSSCSIWVGWGSFRFPAAVRREGGKRWKRRERRTNKNTKKSATAFRFIKSKKLARTQMLRYCSNLFEPFPPLWTRQISHRQHDGATCGGFQLGESQRKWMQIRLANQWREHVAPMRKIQFFIIYSRQKTKKNQKPKNRCSAHSSQPNARRGRIRGDAGSSPRLAY